MSLRASAAGFRAQGRWLVEGIDLVLEAGEILAVLGPNGAGKTTLLRMLSGELASTAGVVALDELDLRRWRAGDLARRRSVLAQATHLDFDFTVEEVVGLGRFARPRRSSAAERLIVEQALDASRALHLRERRYPSLSGGEQARVQFARALAQVWEDEGATRYLLLDEPTAHLDLSHQHQLLGCTRQFSRSGVGVLVILHDPNLALMYADRVMLMRVGRCLRTGPPGAILDAEAILDVYGIEMDRCERPGGGVVLMPRPFEAVTRPREP